MTSINFVLFSIIKLIIIHVDLNQSETYHRFLSRYTIIDLKRNNEQLKNRLKKKTIC